MQESSLNCDKSVTEDRWLGCLSEIEKQLDPQIFAAFLKPLRFSQYEHESQIVVIAAPSKLVIKHFSEKFESLARGILSSRFGCRVAAFKTVVDSTLQTSSHSNTSPYVVVKKRIAPVKDIAAGELALEYASLGEPLSPRYTFSSFVVGNSNQFCHAAAMRVAEQPGASYNPLFIYGGVGLGKTHLLHAIANAVLSRNPKAKVLYMSSETFTNELIHALRFAKMESFKNRLRSTDVLLIDDIQFMRGKERTQEEFFHTFNALYSAKNQIVLTSDKMPQEIPDIEERLRTRFSWGLTADLQAPDFETRVAILNRKATVEGFAVPEDVAHLVAERVSSNVRELEGALTKLHAVSCINNVPITLELAGSALKEIMQPKKVNVTVTDIKTAVAEHFKIKVSDMVSKRRTRNLSFPRHVAMYLCRKHTTASYPEIGSQFGGRDHSSVIHAASVVAGKIKVSEEVRTLTSEIEKSLFS